MKTRLPELLLVAVCLLTAPFSTHAQALSGRDVIERQERQHRAKAEKTTYDMLLVDSQGRQRERALTIFVREGVDELNQILLKFTAPASIAQVGLLTWEQGAGRDDDQWLYLPAKRQVKRIASGGKKNQFMGTDLAFEDLRPENLEAHEYCITGEETVAGQACWIIEARPATEKETKESGYSKRVFSVRKDIFFSVKVEYYDKRGNHLKTTLNEDLKRVEGARWRSHRSSTENIKRKTKTIMLTASQEIGLDLAESLFSQNALKRELR